MVTLINGNWNHLNWNNSDKIQNVYLSDGCIVICEILVTKSPLSVLSNGTTREKRLRYFSTTLSEKWTFILTIYTTYFTVLTCACSKAMNPEVGN